MALFKFFDKKKKVSHKPKTTKKPVKHDKPRVVKKKIKPVKHVKPIKTVKEKPAKTIKIVKAKEIQVKPLINKMPDEKAFDLLKRYRIKIPDYAFCNKEEELIKEAKRIGFPCVLKASGKNIVHKTDVNGVRVDIKTEEDAVKNFNELMKIKGCEKVLVQKMITEGYEIIIGGRKDPQFKRVIALGAGGIFTEFLKDVSFRVSPITKEDAEDMLMEVRFSELILKGFRGQKPANKEAIVDTILTVSRLMEADPKIREIDLNPVFATSQDAIAADVRIILE
jgi:acetyl-CoA synthetase (ADP-forming)